MPTIELPLIVEPEQLEPLLGRPGLLLVDLSQPKTYAQLHIPGACFLDYNQIVAQRQPVGGLLPEPAQLSAALSAIGLTPEQHVVAYDDEGGGRAARLLWTLEAIGHRRYSLLNGGLHAWVNEGHAVDNTPVTPSPSDYQARLDPEATAVAERPFILAHLDDPAVALLDARSPQEYDGSKRFAMRGGHIPGALNLEWTEAMDRGRNLRLKGEAELRGLLEGLGITREKTVIAYCQTHHRSAHTWLVLKWLGYRALGYAGSWSDWGNQPDTPVET